VYKRQPITVSGLSVGNHTIRLERAGYLACRYCKGVACTPPVTLTDPCSFTAVVAVDTVTTYEATMIPRGLPATFDAKVTGVTDGDTISVEYGTWKFDCRLLGINAPEGSNDAYLLKRITCPTCTPEMWNSDKALYDTIKGWAITNMLGKTLTFKIDMTKQYDVFGRRLVVVFDGTTNLCRKELELGYAVVFFYEANTQVETIAFLASEKIAKDAGLGVWEAKGTIHCVSDPTAAEIWLDGVNTGFKTVNRVYDLTGVLVGNHNVTFKKYISAVLNQCSVNVTVVKDSTVNAGCTLVPVFSVTLLSVSAGAAVEVDGAYVGVGRVTVQQAQTGAKAQKVKGNLIEKMLQSLKEDNAKKHGGTW